MRIQYANLYFPSTGPRIDGLATFSIYPSLLCIFCIYEEIVEREFDVVKVDTLPGTPSDYLLD